MATTVAVPCSPSPAELYDKPQPRQVGAATGVGTAVAVPRPPVGIRHAAPVGPVVRQSERRQTVASMWREIQGCGDWAGLVEPLHPVLRGEIVRYGEHVAATYKAFDLDPGSKRYLNCKYGRRRMLEEVGMAGAGYEVTRYIYAAPDVALPGGSSQSRWVGYVAVSSDATTRRLGRRDIVVSFRGTVTGSEWAANMMSALAPAEFDPADRRPEVKVESGFLSLYTSDDASCKFTCGSCRNQLLSEVARLVDKHNQEDVSITLAGHSMGSSLALLLGYDLAELGLNRDGAGNALPITVYSFAGPRVGNSGFKKRCDELGIKVLRLVNVNDPITKLPGIFLNENSRVLGGRVELPWSCSCYTHVGIELALDFFEAMDPACVHDLEAYLGLLKRPKVAQMKKKTSQGEDLVSKAKKLFLEVNFDTGRWQTAALQIGGLILALAQNIEANDF